MSTVFFRKVIGITMVSLIVFCIVLPALCENTAWDCPECGRTGNTGNYCGSCAHPAPWIEGNDEPDAHRQEENLLQQFQTVGNIVTFGCYEQDNNLSNDAEAIEWIVLDVQDKKCLLLSKYGLDAKPYNAEYTATTWEKCTIEDLAEQ